MLWGVCDGGGGFPAFQQGIVKVNMVWFMKMSRSFNHWYRVLATPKSFVVFLQPSRMAAQFTCREMRSS